MTAEGTPVSVNTREEIAVFIGSMLRSVREESGFSLEIVANRLGKSKQWISEVERGLCLPSIATIKSICEALDIDPLSFMVKCLNKIDWNDCHKKDLQAMLSMN